MWVLEGPLASALIDIDHVLALLIPARNPRRRQRGTLLLWRRLALALVLVCETARDVLDEVHLSFSRECKIVLNNSF